MITPPYAVEQGKRENESCGRFATDVMIVEFCVIMSSVKIMRRAVSLNSRSRL